MRKESMADALMTRGPKSDAHMIVEQLERIAAALERIVETGGGGHHRNPDDDNDDRILSFWGP